MNVSCWCQPPHLMDFSKPQWEERCGNGHSARSAMIQAQSSIQLVCLLELVPRTLHHQRLVSGDPISCDVYASLFDGFRRQVGIS
jgi:hypothetical protein